MVGNSRNSYDVPFRSCLGNSWCRAVNSILIAKLYLNVSRITEFTRNQDETILAIQTHFHWVTSLTGVVFPPSCRPSSFRLAAAVVVSDPKSFFKSVENRAASSLRCGYNKIRCL